MADDCGHDKPPALIDKNIKIIHKIYNKISLMIKATEQEINHQNFTIILVQVMRELNKYNLEGFKKKEMAICIMSLLLDELGLPHIISNYSAELIGYIIETSYNMALHRYKRPNKLRFWRG